jgi:DNA-binding CsgD family transcriptional regulator
VKLIRRTETLRSIKVSNPANLGETFYFYDKNTGATHFQVQAGPDGRFPVDEAAGLLAMHCMVRGQAPGDYVVMVRAENEDLDELNLRATKLLEAGKSVKSHVRLTRREEEVLDGVVQSLSNKEIAATLNLSERTVKFHVSSLLAKFQVRGRMELMREATSHAAPLVPAALLPPLQPAKTLMPRLHGFRRPAARAAVVPLAKQQMMA